jgi:hypothetical protein
MKNQPKIEHIRFGKIVIDGHSYNRDVIVLPDRVLPNWWRVEGHLLSYEDLQQALSDPPELLVIGTGIFERMRVPEELQEKVQAAGIEMSILATRDACEFYNQMREGKRVAAALHITC